MYRSIAGRGFAGRCGGFAALPGKATARPGEAAIELYVAVLVRVRGPYDEIPGSQSYRDARTVMTSQSLPNAFCNFGAKRFACPSAATRKEGLLHISK